MFLEIEDLLTPEEVEELRAFGQSAQFVDGRITNPHSQVKNNLHLSDRDAYERSSQLLNAALQRHEVFRNYVFPKRIAPPLLTKYTPGMSYGVHSDAAYLNFGDHQLRTDLSCTIFLNDPADYEGGELAVHLTTQTITIKGAPGSAVVYPSNTLHQVRPVTKGERLVGLTFIESRIRDPELREYLFELNEVASLEGFNISWESRTRLSRVQMGLLRRWSDPA